MGSETLCETIIEGEMLVNDHVLILNYVFHNF